MNRFNRTARITAGLCFVACLLAAGLLLADTWRTTRDFKIDNTDDTVALTLQKPGSGTLTSNLLEAFSGSTLVFKLPPTGILPLAHGGTAAATAAGAKTALGIQAGAATTSDDGTVTNTFATAFSAAPKVVLTAAADALGVVPYLSAVTATNFTLVGATNLAYHYIAIGAP